MTRPLPAGDGSLSVTLRLQRCPGDSGVFFGWVPVTTCPAEHSTREPFAIVDAVWLDDSTGAVVTSWDDLEDLENGTSSAPRVGQLKDKDTLKMRYHPDHGALWAQRNGDAEVLLVPSGLRADLVPAVAMSWTWDRVTIVD
jgi:hypothetical protein